MVHDKGSGASSKSPVRPSSLRSSSRRTSLRHKRTTRGSPSSLDAETSNNLNNVFWSTVSTLHLPEQGQFTGATSTHTRPTPSCVFNSAKFGSHHQRINKNGGFPLRSRNEKSVLDKVEDMDIDHQSDHEGNNVDAKVPETSAKGTTQGFPSAAVEKVVDEAKKDNKLKQDKKEKLQVPLKGKKNTCESENGPKTVKKKPIYIILHAALVRVGGITGKALSPVRVQAERILIQMEIKSDAATEVLSFRIPCRELVAVQANLSKPPYILVAFINHDYSQSVVGAKKNCALNKIKGTSIDELEMVIQLTYDSIPKDVKKDLEMLRSDLSNVRWKEISSSQAGDIISGKAAKDCVDSPEEAKVSDKQRHILKVQGNRKKVNKCENDDATSIDGPKEAIPAKSDEEENDCNVPEKVVPAKKERRENTVGERQALSEKIVNRRKRTYHETAKISLPEILVDNSNVLEEKVMKQPEQDETMEKTCHSEVAAKDEASNPTETLKCIPSPDQSYNENHLNARRLSELEEIIAQKEELLNQRRVTVELQELQLEQERNTVRLLRSSLREEQKTRRDLETRYEAINGELLARNSREMLVGTRVHEMERELSQLNISLTDVRSENQRLVQEISEVRGRIVASEEALNQERNTVATLQEDLETRRATFDSFREEIRRKDSEIKREQDLRTEAVGRRNEIERTLTTRTEEYEERLRRSDEERTRVSREFQECNNQLVATREQMDDVNSSLRRAQETIEEYSRMQPRDWTISRDEVTISENVLGQGAWGWVKEGMFRGTKVAVKQMHELIVSPHNRRLFEREMQMAARCRHPNLLQFIGATNDNALALLVTELLETNLRTVLTQRSLCHDEVLTLALDVARALNYLHLNKPFPIIHRDISSTNVLLWKRENVWHGKLSDYGAANFMRQCMTVSPGASIYAAPEAMTSAQSTKVDVFSFGLLSCEMCIRELPVPDHTNDQIRLITNGHFRDLVQRCTSMTPDNRPSMHDVLSALQHMCANTTLGIVSVNSRQVLL